MSIRAVALMLLAGIPATGHAGVTETSQRQLYEVRQAPGMSLLEALNRATPIREAGQPFHGYTDWRIHWNYRYRPRSDGLCGVSSVDVRLAVTMTLPDLKESTAEGAAQFAAYFPALVEHEDGHQRIGAAAARDVEAAIAQLPPAPSCPMLEREIARAANDLVERARQNNKAYDAATRHGCTQGACLKR